MWGRENLTVVIETRNCINWW